MISQRFARAPRIVCFAKFLLEAYLSYWLTLCDIGNRAIINGIRLTLGWKGIPHATNVGEIHEECMNMRGLSFGCPVKAAYCA